MEGKTKGVGEIVRFNKVVSHGVQILSGDVCSRYYKVPIILIDYIPPEDAHPYAQGERFKFWIKLEGSEYKKLIKQLKCGLKEISIWFDEEGREALKRYLNGEGKDNN